MFLYKSIGLSVRIALYFSICWQQTFQKAKHIEIQELNLTPH